MLTKVKRLIDNHHMLSAGDKVIAACSGGPDSLALVHILMRLRSEYDFCIFVAHVDHMLRGGESAEDARFVAKFCKENGLHCYQAAVNVPAFMRESGLCAEEAARNLRYQFLYEAAKEAGCAKIATGHHQDDQAETVLLHLLRGAGSGGIRGMRPVNGAIIRPLLAVTRNEINDYCSQHRLCVRHDSTNSTTEYLRNRIRLQLLPLLETTYNPEIKSALLRTACIVGEENDFIRGEAGKLWDSAAVCDRDKIRLFIEPVKNSHVAVQREIFRLAIEKKQGNLRGISFDHVEKLIQMLQRGRVGALFVLPGGTVVRRGYREMLIGENPAGMSESPSGIHPPGYLLNIPGTTWVPELAIEIAAQISHAPQVNSKTAAMFDWEQVQFPLYVRTRTVGDRFWPNGLDGSKKLKEFFIDSKIPQEIRDTIPLVCDREGILWVAGYRHSGRARVTGGTQRILVLHINKQEAKT
jgi:tRNA(Ile)-lysidine synthase